MNFFLVWKNHISQFPPLKKTVHSPASCQIFDDRWLRSFSKPLRGHRCRANGRGGQGAIYPRGWPMGKRLFNMMRCVSLEKKAVVSNFSVGSRFSEFSVISMNFLLQKYPQFLFLWATKLVVLNGRKDWCHPSCPGNLWQVGWGLLRGSGMSNENHKNLVLLRIFTRFQGDERLIFFGFRDGISCFWGPSILQSDIFLEKVNQIFQIIWLDFQGQLLFLMFGKSSSLIFHFHMGGD